MAIQLNRGVDANRAGFESAIMRLISDSQNRYSLIVYVYKDADKVFDKQAYAVLSLGSGRRVNFLLTHFDLQFLDDETDKPLPKSVSKLFEEAFYGRVY